MTNQSVPFAAERRMADTPGPKAVPAPLTGTSRRSARVVVVDRDLLVSDLLSRYLRQQHDVLPPTSDLHRFEAVLASRHPDIALWDLALGGRRTFEVLGDLVRRFAGTRFVVASSHGGASLVTRTLVAGGKGFVVKSCTPEELAEAVRTVLAGEVYIPDQTRSMLEQQCGSLNAGLTGQQQHVLTELRSGGTQREVAARLGLAVSTLEKHIRAIKRKCAVDNTRKWFRWHSVAGEDA